MRIALCCVLLAGAARAAAAQDSVVTFGEPETPLTINGFGVANWSYDDNLKQNTFAGSKLAVSLFRPWSDRLYFFGQLTTALVPPEDSAGEPTTEIEIDNLIVNWQPASSLALRFGRFDAPIGFERDDEPLNLIPGNSFNFELARPSKFTGLQARYLFSPVVNLSAFVVNGWDLPLDNNSAKTGGLRMEVIPSDRLSLGLNGIYGPEAASENRSRRSLLSADLAYDAAAKFILGVEANFGRETAPGSPTVSWAGVVATGFLRVARSLGLSIRAETLRDRDGFLTGTAQTLQSITVSPWYFYREAQEGVFSAIDRTSFRIPAFSVRPALRVDHSTVAAFPTADGGSQQTSLTALVELVYVF